MDSKRNRGSTHLASKLFIQSQSALRELDRSRSPRVETGRIGVCREAREDRLRRTELRGTRNGVQSSDPSEPVLFMKACLATGANDEIAIPPGAEKADWEVELAVVIGRHAYRVSEADALSYLAGYCIMDDVSERAYQHEQGPVDQRQKSARLRPPSAPSWSLPTKCATPGI